MARLVLPRLAAVVAGLSLAVCSPLQASAPLFLVEPTLNLPANTVVVPASYGPSVFSADFNGDGLPDAAVFTATYSGTPSTGTTTSTNLLLLLANSGNAPTPSPISLPCAGLTAGEMAAADINGDKKLDLVVSCQGTFLVALLGNGDGTFQAPVVTTLPGYPGNFVLADFNGDGLADAAYPSQAGFAVALSQGNGQFGTPLSHALTGNFSFTGTGDFNGDGKQDLLFQGAEATYVLGNGDGTFQAPAALPTNVGKFAIADFNHDGFSDLAYSTAISTGTPAFASDLTILNGGPSGLATSGRTIATNGASTAQFLIAMDLTGSGNLDLVQTNDSSVTTNTLVFLGDGAGNFTPPTSYAGYETAGVADVNGDGFPDLVGIDAAAGTILYAAGNKDGSFLALPNTPNGQGAQPMVAGDLNGDGISDAVLNAQSGAPLVFLGRGDGRFTPVPDGGLPPAPIGTFPYPANFSVLGDFNADGNLDVASFFPGGVQGGITAGAVSLFLGGGDGTLTLKQQQTLNTEVLTAAVAGDFNSDKKLDLIYTNGAGCWFLAGNGDGTFAPPVQITLLNAQPVAIISADFNGDGIPDLVVADKSLGTIVYLGNGNGTFKPISPGLPLSTVFAAGDVNQDGKTDLVLVDESQNPAQLEVYSGNGDGTFSSSPVYSAADGYAPAAIAIGDLNDDGLPDIVSGPSLNVFINGGGDAFTEDPESYFAGVPSTTTPLALVRLNSNAPGAGPKQALDALLYTSGGLTSVLNQLNAPPKPAATIAVELPAGVTSITTGASLSLTAALSVIGSTAPTGTVTFFAGAQQLGVASVSNGIATVSATITGSGTVTIRGVYSGDANYGASTGFASVSVTAPASTTTTLSASATGINEQQQVTLTATVQGNTPTGSVTFFNGATSIATATISGDTATLTTSFATAGAISLTANYAGDANNLPSTSAPVTVTVAAPGFAISVSPASATVTAGQSATFTIAVTPSGGFSSPVGLSCGTLPTLATCSFASAAVTPANGQPAQLKLTITTAAASTAKLGNGSPSLPGERPWVPAGGVLSLAGIFGLLSGAGKHRRAKGYLQTLALLMLISGLGACIAGCSSGSNGSSTHVSGTPTGTSTVTITGSVSGSSSPQTATLQLTVQ